MFLSLKMLSEKRIRAFIAATLDDKTRSQIQNRIKQLKKNLSPDQIHWAPMENMHLTLRFLGNIEKSQLKPLIEAVTTTLPPIQTRLQLNLGQTIFFPDAKHPRFITLDVLQNPALEKFAALIESAIVQSGFEKDTRPFRPHLTIGRIKKSLGRDFKLPKDPEKIHQTNTEIILFQSLFEANGVIHQPLHRLFR